MARKGKHLFAFIQSLSPSEVRVVRHQFAFQPGAKRYEAIFDVLLKMESDDPKVFQRRIKRKVPDASRYKILLKNLAVYKIYLYDAILDALAVHYTHPRAELDILVRKVEIEIQHQHWSNAQKLLRIAQDRASKIERFDILIRLLEAEREMTSALPKNKGRNLDVISQDIEKVSAQIANHEAFRKVAQRIEQQHKAKHRNRGVINLGAIETLAKEPILQSQECALSSRARIFFNTCQFEIHNALRKTADALTFLQDSYDLFQANSELKVAMPKQYIELLPRLALTLYLVGDHRAAMGTVREVRSLANTYPPERVLGKITVTDLTIAYAYSDHTLGYQALIDVENRYDTMKPFLQPESDIVICYTAFRLSLHLKEYDLAKEWAKKVIYTDHQTTRLDFQVITRVLHLIVLYERKEWELIDYYGPAHQKFIKKQAQLFPHEKALIRFLQKAADHLVLKTIIPALQALKLDIQNSTRSTSEQVALQYFDVMQWIETQIHRYTNQSL